MNTLLGDPCLTWTMTVDDFANRLKWEIDWWDDRMCPMVWYCCNWVPDDSCVPVDYYKWGLN